MKRSICLYPLVIVFIGGCASDRPEQQSGSVAKDSTLDGRAKIGHESKRLDGVDNSIGNTLRVGMEFKDAVAILEAHRAKYIPLQLIGGIRYYRLQSGEALEILSEKGQAEPKVQSIALSKYRPKSWDSKIDPERTKWFQSFQNVNQFQLTQTPNKQLQATRD